LSYTKDKRQITERRSPRGLKCQSAGVKNKHEKIWKTRKNFRSKIVGILQVEVNPQRGGFVPMWSIDGCLRIDLSPWSSGDSEDLPDENKY